MNDKTSILEDIKSLAKKVVGIEKEEIQLEEVKITDEVVVALAQEKLENGTVLEAEAFEAGQPVFIVNEDERIPLPIGEYTMADGSALVVSEEGVIAEVKAKEAEEPEAEVEAGAEFVTVEDFNKAIDEIKSMFSSEKEKLENEKIDLEEKNVELKAELDKEPATELIKHSPEVIEAKVTTAQGRILQKLRNTNK